jgi:hypothetical protein
MSSAKLHVLPAFALCDPENITGIIKNCRNSTSECCTHTCQQCTTACDSSQPHQCGGRCFSDAGAQLCASNCGGGLCLSGGTCVFSEQAMPNHCSAPLSCSAGQRSCQTSSTTSSCQTITADNCGPGCLGACELMQHCINPQLSFQWILLFAVTTLAFMCQQ